jgi:predicted Rossmann-fold nucleotide-binding protein
VGYYDGLIEFWGKMATVGFLRPQHRELLIVGTSLDELLDKMAAFVPAQPIVR